jgi:hypothetical protein
MTEYYWSTPQNRVHYDGETGTVVLDWLDYNTSQNFREATIKSVSIFQIKITLHQILKKFVNKIGKLDLGGNDSNVFDINILYLARIDKIKKQPKIISGHREVENYLRRGSEIHFR